MSRKSLLLSFGACALTALGAHYLMFEMRYFWYVTAEDAHFMHLLYTACVTVILLLWAFFPSRIAVALVGTFALFFPHLFFAADARPVLGRAIDAQSVAVATAVMALLLFATHLRLKSGRSAA